MLSIGRLGPAGGRYYTSQVASGAEDYYLGSGEAPGRWFGSGLADLDLEAGAVVGTEAFARLLDGRHPHSGQPLAASGAGRVQGLDLTFSAPKSVSLLWALHPDPEVRRAVASAHDRAVADAVRFLESDAVRGRRGHNGSVRVETSGLVAAGFAHRSSRAGDPQLHTHLVAANLIHGSDGRWTALDTRAVYRHARTAGFVYQARLRHELTAALGVGWGSVRAGQADLDGIDRDTVEAFSTRRAQIVDALETRGLSTANAARVATLDTRPTKPGPETGMGLLERWQHHAATLGIDLAGLVGPGREPRQPATVVADLVAAAGLTAHTSTFDRRDLIRGLAAAHVDGATLDRLEELVRQVVGRAATVELTAPDTEPALRRWTTVDLLATEADLFRTAERAGTRDAPVAEPAAIHDALDARPQLSDEQRRLVEGVCTTRAGVVVVVGKAGTGKTFTLDACRAAWETSGIPVVGAALSARAAAELQAGSGIPSTTLARLVADLDRPEGRPPFGAVIVVDEAGMVGTRQLHTLITAAGRYGWKLVLVGDPRQLPEIDAGGAFAALAGRVPTWTLSANVRQAEGWERAALDQLRDHQPAPAVAAYQTHGRVTVADTAAQLRDQMVADWHAARLDGHSALMLAVRRVEVDALNTAAQTSRVAAGELDPATVVEVGGRRFMVGDEASCARNDRRAGLINGTRLILTHLEPTNQLIQGVTPEGTEMTVPWEYAVSRQLNLGYALTVYKAQGVTVDRAFLLGDDRLFAEAGYVGLSRARQSNRLYIIATPIPHQVTSPQGRDTDQIIAALGVTRAQTLSTNHATGTETLGGRSLRDLLVEQHRLVEAITADMPPDPTRRLAAIAETRRAIDAAPADASWLSAAVGQLSLETLTLAGEQLARHCWADRHRPHGERLARITATIEQRADHIARTAALDPPAELVDLIGSVPDHPLHRREWAHTAGRIAVWADITGRNPTELPRTSHPADLIEQPWWNRARTALEHTRHLELDRHHEKGLSL